MTNRNVLIAAIVVVGAGIGFFALKGNTPVPNGTEGTIGAANRYQENQISGEDVKLTDPSIQAFLQSDAFHKIQTNPELAKAIASEQFRQAIQQDAFQTAMAEMSQGRMVTADNAPGGKMSTDNSPDRRISPDWAPGRKLFLPASMPTKRFITTYQVVGRSVRADAWGALAQKPGVRKLFMSKDFLAIASTDGFVQAMDALNQARTDAMAKGGTELANFKVTEALAATADGQAIQKTSAWDKLMADASARQVIESAVFAEFFSQKTNADFAISTAELARNAELWSFVNSANMAQALSNEAVATVVADGSLFTLMSSPDGMAVLTSPELYQIGRSEAASAQVFGELSRGVVTNP